MKNQNLAEKTIAELRNKFQKNMLTGGYVAIDNSELHDDLNDSCVTVKEILDQETWVMSDGSYITRNEDIYWTGDDVDDFEITEDLENEKQNNTLAC